MRDNQKVKDVVEANNDVFSLTDEKLFGESFYAALHCRAKGFKYLREARQELGFHPRGTKCFKPNHYDVKSQSFNPGLQYPHLHGPVHTPDNNRWDTPPV